MNIVFITPAQATHAFEQGGLLALIISLGVLAALLPPKVRAGVGNRFAVLAPVTVFAILLSLSAWLSYGRFVSTALSPTGAELQFTGPFNAPVILPRQRIAEVLFGFPGKSADTCTITFVTKTGDRYRSATSNRRQADCKALRGEMLIALGLSAD